MNTSDQDALKRSPIKTALVIGALGVVYGDIGTSPLYSIKECFHPNHGLTPTSDNVLGVLSLIVWSLIIIITIKYLVFVLRANNRGEGGILALVALACPERASSKGSGSGRATGLFVLLGLFGAALLYGDGMITPAISVIGAVEGLSIVAPRFEPFVVPIAVVIIFFLFWFQSHGTGKMGKIFGPVTLIWFAVIAALGIAETIKHPEVFKALNPWMGANFLLENGYRGFVVLGSVFLVVTGGESLYADMGHFGLRPIRRAWFVVVLPALLLNYFGQGALLLSDPSAVSSPFFKLAPPWALVPLVILATIAAVIASQALIAGAYSLTMQAIQLGYCPRMEVDHTSVTERGQIYIPQINWILMLSCIGLVIGFRTSSNLAAAYGVGVSLTMLITTVLFYVAARRVWNWPVWKAGLLVGAFAIIECAFFGANLLKVAHGGWFPLLVGAVIFTLLTTWKKGRRILGERLRSASFPLPMFLDDVKANPPHRVRGTAVFLAGNSEGTPMALLHNLKHNQVLHERVVILTVVTDEVPYVEKSERFELTDLGNGFSRVIGHYGFMEDPDVPRLLERCTEEGFKFDPHHTTYFVSRETLIATKKHGMALWREILFSFMARNSQRATAFFRLPANRVVELGMQVEI